jgi:PAS domain-containing protein
VIRISAESPSRAPLVAAIRQPWSRFLAAGLVCTLLYSLRSGPIVQTTLLVLVSGGATGAVLAGMRRFRPARPLPWIFMAGCQGLWAVAWIIWQWHVIASGVAPDPGSMADALFLAGDACQIGGLVVLLRGRGSGLEPLVDTALVAIAVGLIAFSPLIEQTVIRSALSILAIVPLLAAALRRGPRDTATAAFILSCFAVWGTFAGGVPFAAETRNDAFLMLIAFMIGCAVPSLILSADVAERKRVEARLRQQSQDLHAVFSQAIVGISRIDTSGRFTLLNDRFCEIVQRASNELLRQRIQDIVDPEDQAQMRELLGQAVSA